MIVYESAHRAAAVCCRAHASHRAQPSTAMPYSWLTEKTFYHGHHGRSFGCCADAILSRKDFILVRASILLLLGSGALNESSIGRSCRYVPYQQFQFVCAQQLWLTRVMLHARGLYVPTVVIHKNDAIRCRMLSTDTHTPHTAANGRHPNYYYYCYCYSVEFNANVSNVTQFLD